jgi:hypothetical protein
MSLMKSILLGSAAGLVAVAGAQAADLPTKKAAPVEYVKICNVGGITGWTLPGTDTCVKLSGYITAQFTGGNIGTSYGYGTSYGAALAISEFNFLHGTNIPGPFNIDHVAGQRFLVADSDNFRRNVTGWTTRANFGFDFASNTAWGPLIGHFDINAENGNGFDNTGNNTYLNTGYITWAGITAGKAPSFYSFVGGGPNWANFFSPDQKGFNEPDLLAYTASFGGGFSATIALQSPGSNGSSGGGTQMTGHGGYANGSILGSPGQIVFAGQRVPDIVGNLHVTEGWGEAQISGVLHQVDVRDASLGDYFGNGFYGDNECGVAFYGPNSILTPCNASENKFGWGIDAGVKLLLPSFGAGDFFVLTGSYTQNAVWYSGLPDGMWGENGQVNGNGQPMYLADAFFNPATNSWDSPTAWSVSAWFEHHFSPQFYIDLVGSVGGVNWSGQGGYCAAPNVSGCGLNAGFNGWEGSYLSPHAFTWLVGADLGWSPVTNLNFDLELMYQAVNQSRPNGFFGTAYLPNGFTPGYFVPGQWEGNSSGFAGRLRITRYF